ncbi:MAG TPA: molybdopterin cofactor-binding domain-containing protein, partial [Terriglobales bacterium]
MPTPDPEVKQHDITRLQHHFELARRDFFKVLGGGIVVCVASAHAVSQESGGRERSRPEMPATLDSWLHIGEDGQITVFTGKVEVGQNSRTALTQQVAEELRVPITSIRMLMGDTDLTPFDMGTFGSRTTPQMGTQLRKAGASARAVLTQMAAAKWQVPENSLTASDGKIHDTKSGRAFSYAELTNGQKLTKVILDDPPVTPPADWKIAGTSVPKRDARDFVTGAHRYSADQMRPGMLYGKVVRPSAFHATLASCDTSQAEKIP